MYIGNVATNNSGSITPLQTKLKKCTIKTLEGSCHIAAANVCSKPHVKYLDSIINN